MAAILGKTVGHMGATGQQLHIAINRLRTARTASGACWPPDGADETASSLSKYRPWRRTGSRRSAWASGAASSSQVKDSLQEDDDGGGRVPLWKRTFYPFEPWIIRWEISVSGLITWGLIELPFKVCFEAEESGPWDGAALFSLFIDAILMCDVLIKFRTGYCEPLTGARAPPNPPSPLHPCAQGPRVCRRNSPACATAPAAGGTRPGAVIMEPKKIATNYLESWFVLDFFTSLPIAWF